MKPQSSYDASKDESLFSKESTVGANVLEVTVFSYNNGPKKLQISKKVADKEGELTYAKKLGRLTKDEVKALSILFAEAYKNM